MSGNTPTVRTVRFGAGRAWSVHQLLLAGLAGLGALAYLVALHQASGGFDAVFWLLVPLAWFLLPVTATGWPLAYWGVMILGWFHLVPAGSFSPWSILAACGLLLGHTAAAHGASAPPGAVLPGRTVRRWTRQGLVALGATLAVGLAAGLLDAAGGLGGVAATAQVAGLIALAVGVWLLRGHEPERD